ncbi:MAG: AI-2E family transporter [Hyphomicrobiales bacterium]|nr:AI-2E family transporter [Hyphomicrobiales bacterium]
MTLNLSPHTLYWIIALSLAVLLVAFLGDILTPFVLGGVIAYLFDPIVTRLHREGLSRGVSAFVIVCALAALVLLAIALLVPVLFAQFSALVENFPRYLQQLQTYIAERWPDWLQSLRPQTVAADAPPEQGAFSGQLTGWAVEQLKGLAANGLALANSLALLFVTPVVAFFLLKDWRKLLNSVDETLPRQDAPEIRSIAAEIDTTLSSYLRGTATVILLLSAIFMIGLELVGLDYGLVIGLGAGILSFIPYVGALAGLVIGGAVAFAQFWPDWVQIVLVLGVFLGGQAFEGNVLTPKIVGDNVRLHPVWLIFALLAFGYAFGFVGLLIAVPAAAICGVLVRRALQKYYESEAYLGRKAPHPQ